MPEIRPSKQEGAGKAGCWLAPAVSCADVQRKCAHEHTGSSRNNRPSLRNGLTAYGALSPATNSSCHRHRRIDGLARPGWARNTSADLTPATGARTTRFCRTLQHRSSTRAEIAHGVIRPANSNACRRCRVHRIPCPTYATIMIRPSVGRDGEAYSFDLPDGLSGIFLREGLDRKSGDLPVRRFYIVVCETAKGA